MPDIDSWMLVFRTRKYKLKYIRVISQVKEAGHGAVSGFVWSGYF